MKPRFISMKKLSVAVALVLMTSTMAIGADLKIGMQEDPDSLDPVLARTYVSRIVFTSMCDKLIDIDKDLNLIPQLAESWEWSDDSLELTLQLRPDVKFHDGTAFDAEAVKANLNRAKTLKNSQRKGELASIVDMNVTGPLEIKLTVDEPDPTLLAQFTDRAGMMVSPATFDADKPVARHPVCAGPYKFVKRTQNDRIVLEHFDDYYDADAYHFDQVSFLPIPDATVRLQNVQSGSLQLIADVSPNDLPIAKNDARLTVDSVTGLGFQQLTFNIGNGPRAEDNPAKHKLVRQALQMTIDRDAINQVIGMGEYRPAQSPFPPASEYFDEETFPVTKPDIEKAKALLAEAGYADGVNIQFNFGNDTIASSLAELIQSSAAPAGIKLNLQPMEFASMLSAGVSGEFEMEMFFWSGRIDPHSNYYIFAGCDGFFNDGKYCNDEVQDALEKAKKEPDVDTRKALYKQAFTITNDELPQIFLYYQPYIYAMTKKLEGFEAYPDGMIRLRNVQLQD